MCEYSMSRVVPTFLRGLSLYKDRKVIMETSSSRGRDKHQA